MNLLVLVLLAQSQVQAKVETPREPPKWEVFMGVQGGVRPDTLGGGGGGLVGVSRLFFNFLRPELAVGLGVYSQPVDVLTMIRLGARFEWPGGLGRDRRWHPFVNVAFAHQHEAGWEHVSHDPVPVVIGLSEHGVNHRSGVEAGLGISYDFLARKGSIFSGRVTVKASYTHLLGVGPPRYIDLTTLMGLCF